MIFDKTGTLTKGEFEVSDIVVLGNDLNEEELIRLATSLEQHSERPIAKGIVNYASAKGIRLYRVEDFKALPGRGIMGVINGRKVMVVSAGYLREQCSCK